MINVNVGNGKPRKPRKPKKVKPKKVKPSAISRALVKSSKESAKRGARSSALVKKGLKRKTKSVLGIGTSKRKKPQGFQDAITRKGKSAIRGGSAALAAFIAARYSEKAIAKYQDYAGRLRRSRRLIKQIVEIDANTFRIRQHIVKTDTEGNNPYSCTCPDFSQFSDDARNWLGSKAGPFNPCKHMMAVRDRATAGSKWSCSGGVCSASDSGYDTKADCERAVRLANFKGGQCGGGALYIIQLSADNITWTTYSGALNGPIISFTVQRNITGDRWTTYVKASPQEGFNEIPSATAINASAEPYKRVVYIGGGSAGDCGDPPQNNCPL